MILKVTADPEILEHAPHKKKEYIWTVSGAQPFTTSLASLKRLLGIATPTAGFAEYGYDLYTVRHTPEGVQPQHIIDVGCTPDSYGLRSGKCVFVRRLKVAVLHAKALKSTVRCNEVFDLLVYGTDVRGNGQPLPEGGMLKLLPERVGPGGTTGKVLAGVTMQGTGDGTSIEFLFSNLMFLIPGQYYMKVELSHPTTDPIDDGHSQMIHVCAEPYPSLGESALHHVGRYALRLTFTADCDGHLFYLVFREDKTEIPSLLPEKLRELSLQGIEMERRKAVVKLSERAEDDGEGAGVIAGCVCSGAGVVKTGCQSLQILVPLAFGGRYCLLYCTDNMKKTNVSPHIRSLKVHVSELTPQTPVLTNVTLDCAAGGEGVVRLSFDSDEVGHVHYAIADEGSYHPLDGREFIKDVAAKGRGPTRFISQGTLPIGRGVGHSAMLPTDGLRAGQMVDFWFTTEALAVDGPSPPPPAPVCRTLLIPFEDPPCVTSFGVLPCQDRPAILMHLEVDHPGVVHFVVCRPGLGHLLLPSQLKELAAEGPDGDGAVAAGTLPMLDTRPKTFTVVKPVPTELTGKVLVGDFEPGAAYEVFYLADNRTGDNPSTAVSKPYPVTLPLYPDYTPTLPAEEREEERADTAAATKATSEDPLEEVASHPPTHAHGYGLCIEAFDEEDWENDLGALKSLFVSEAPFETEMLPYPSAGPLQDAFFLGQNERRVRDVEHQFVLMQQRVLDLESNLEQCLRELERAKSDEEQFTTRLSRVAEEVRMQVALKEGLEKWKKEHIGMITAEIESECKEMQGEIDTLLEANLDWEQRVQEVRDRNHALDRIIRETERKREEYIMVLKERCIRHSEELKRTPDKTDEVLRLRKVRDEQTKELEMLREKVRQHRPPEPEREKEHVDVEHQYEELKQPEPAIVTRLLTLPKGGLRVLTTVKGGGLQAMRFKHSVTAEILQLGDDRNELCVTGQAENVLAMVHEVERIYEAHHMVITSRVAEAHTFQHLLQQQRQPQPA